MEQQALNYARTQADGLDNIAPTLHQGQYAWQYAQSDNFFSPEEQAAVLRRELEPYRAQLESKLTQIGWGPYHLSKHPTVGEDLFSGRQTVALEMWLSADLKMEGSLRIVMTPQGPDIRVTPVQKALSIPQQVGSIRFSAAERQQLQQEGALPRPLFVQDQGNFVPTYVRLDPTTNAVELWRVQADKLPTKLMGIDLTKDQQLQLVSGHSVRLKGLIDQQGEPFNATVSISPARQQLEFSDLSRLDVQLRPDNHYSQQLAQNNDGAKTDLTRSLETSIGGQITTSSQLDTVEKLLTKQTEQQSAGAKTRLA